VPTTFDYLTLAGSFGLFFTLFLLFCRYLPMVAMAEVKTVEAASHSHGSGAALTGHQPTGEGATA
jgi:molybdopterin-containing oxidoreductase family membrane subunit